ncbi:hypothetical protein TELCIR_01052 [Teladorsagia circumcincta]|uniref:Uncharacterized protein n=1 Tax=Teladorsagia circumcincta TaxID=45464 RepID=A0A2G9V543_TELCI|nr:hypothetical protein TELCIR_01052 [Teladorsagia circumcincta]
MVFVDLNPLVVSGYYVIFVLVAVSMNILIIYLIKNRVLWSISSSALLPVGPCRLFGPMTCFVTSNVINALTVYVELLIVYTMFCRYRMLQSQEMRTETFAIGFVTTAILPRTLLVFFVFKLATVGINVT